MSAIFGLCSFDGRPVPPESLEVMQEVMSSWGPDGCHHWRQDNAGLGQALLVVTPASRYEVMPRHEPESKQVLVAAARLDNRDELFDTLGIPQPDRSSTPDGRLVQLAFKRWGESCPPKLYGDWSFAVWDYRRQRLFLTRDQMGNTGLFYYHQPPFFAFASSPKALLALPEVDRRLNEGQLARYLTHFSKPYNPDTFWLGIHQLLPGFRAVITPARCRIDQYWRPEDACPIRLGSEQEYLDGFLEHYRRAVRCRLESLRPVGVTLSSGLDSGSVAALAAEALRNREEKLTAFTSVPLYDTQALNLKGLSNEWDLAHAHTRYAPNLVHVPIRSESISPLAALESFLDLDPEPPEAPGNLFWFLDLFQEARRRGLGVLLTGQNGNGSVSWYGGRDYIFHQCLRGNGRTVRHCLTSWRKKRRCSWWPLVKQHILRPLLGPLWSQRHRLVVHPFSPPWMEYSAIHPDFARRLRLREAMRDSRHDASYRQPKAPHQERLNLLWLVGMQAGPFYHTQGSAFGFEIRDPTADVRLLDFCLGLPEEQFIGPEGDRLLVRRNLAGLMPSEILWNTLHGYQGIDLPWRLLACRNEVEAALHRLDISPGANEFIHLDKLHQAWKIIQADQTLGSASLEVILFMRGLTAGIFCDRLENS
jgi:asparagine synthase (glutamine-hydrolysing)